eukprot:m.353533 g.353533  ORF g.353533 m.353533 type:complete len:72 (-) comp16592_c1_seq2:91-306(-)
MTWWLSWQVQRKRAKLEPLYELSSSRYSQSIRSHVASSDVLVTSVVVMVDVDGDGAGRIVRMLDSVEPTRA